MNPSKIDSIKKIGYPKTKKDVRSFLGMVKYYHSFIPDFTGIATPLFNKLLNHQPDTITLTQEMLKENVIRPSSSSYNSAVD